MANMNMLQLYTLLAAGDPEGLDWILEHPNGFRAMLYDNSLGFYEFFASLPTPPESSWFIDLIVKLSDPEDDLLAINLREFFQNADPQAFKRWSRYHYESLPDSKLRNTLDTLLQEGLRRQGWIIDNLKEKLHRHQMVQFINHRGYKYVRPFHQKSYGYGDGPIEAGDLVIFRPEETNEIAPGIRITHFQLVRRPEEK